MTCVLEGVLSVVIDCVSCPAEVESVCYLETCYVTVNSGKGNLSAHHNAPLSE